MATEAATQPPQSGPDASIANGTGMDALMDDAKKRGLHEEISRLTDNHLVYTDAAGGKLSFAPVDWQKPGLRILDSATADGMCHYDSPHMTRLMNTQVSGCRTCASEPVPSPRSRLTLVLILLLISSPTLAPKGLSSLSSPLRSRGPLNGTNPLTWCTSAKSLDSVETFPLSRPSLTSAASPSLEDGSSLWN